MVGAHVVAAQLGDRALVASANAAYVHGMDLVLLISGIAALVTALLAAALLPKPERSPAPAPEQDTAVAPTPADAGQ